MRLKISFGNSVGLIAGLLLSTDALLIRLIGIEDTWLIVVIRGILMWSTFLTIYLCKPDWRLIIGQPWPTKNNILPVIFFALASTFFINAIAKGDTSTALFIISATPIFSAILARVFFYTKIEKSMLITAVFGLLGVWIVMYGNGHTNTKPVIYYSVATAIAMALAFLFSEKVEGGRVGLPSLGAAVAALFVFLTMNASYTENVDILTSFPTGLWVLLEGMIVMPLSLGLLALATRYVPATNVGLFLLLETALAPLWIWISLNETPSLYAICGGVIIVSSLLAHSAYSSKI